MNAFEFKIVDYSMRLNPSENVYVGLGKGPASTLVWVALHLMGRFADLF
jgi:hypothetical protein